MNREDIYLKKVKIVKEKIKKVYRECNYDWMIGFSGGKDSSVLVQIILESLTEIKTKLKNKIYIVSSDTLIENPIVLEQLNNSLEILQTYADEKQLPVEVFKVTPDINETFWVNLIGRGYPLPNQSFRWCTDRLKIKPMNDYMEEISKKSKKEILTVLGVRKGESLSRDIKMDKTKIEDSDLRINNTNGKYIFSPIEEFQLYDIWKYLAESNINFFKKNNDKLSILYEDSSVGTGECPSSLDDKLQKGCGNSRWGCWLCPVVTQDKSLQGFINSGQDWLQPLMSFREKLMKERDLLKNRYHGSLRIMKNKKIVTLVKYRYMDLKFKNGIYYLPKKEGREEIIFGEINEDFTKLKYNKKVFKIISESEYRKKVDQRKINPYVEGEIPLFNFVIKLDKNLDNDKLSIVGLGPYTLDYRKELLIEILKLKKAMKKYKIEIISDEEINKIKEIFKIVMEALENDRYLDEKISGLFEQIKGYN
ncbi:DNA phosphorothioation system sulfurtransferase DndC [Spiroplasma floricola]|uniref:DNA sulfur modification protein DndC n=1 Tax=Spiroplasma floricola 23-6 TaxID=1336749 RepID=A0A2K8SFY8_9MOLU|nr:DNA phosphorothioation system sulfurtransferase DndC [Spiroplasma floricola]AUB31740.1 DNA sulfur modification protein DndC [Spiroplasma floricola 23-6]